MKKKEVLKLNEDLKKVGSLKGVKFAYAIAKNKARLSKEVEALIKATEPSEEFMKVDEKINKDRLKLAEEYADKENGKPIIEGDKYKMSIEKQEKLEKELEKMKKKHKKLYEEREQQRKDYNKMIEEESDFEPYTIEMKELPEDISVDQLSAIEVLVK